PLTVADELVVEGGVALRDRLQFVVEVEHDLVQGKLVGEYDPVRGEVLQGLLHAAALLAEGEQAAQEVVAGDDRRGDVRLLDPLDVVGRGKEVRVGNLEDVAGGRGDAVVDAGRGRDQVEIELALEALLDDLHVEEAQEAAAEAEAQGRRVLR